MARKLDRTDLDLLADLLHDYIDGINDGSTVGTSLVYGEDDLTDLMELHNTLIEMRDEM